MTARRGPFGVIHRIIAGKGLVFCAALAVLAIAGCGGGGGRSLPSEPYRLSGPRCLGILADRGITALPWASPGARGCRVDTPVLASAGRLARFTPALKTSCAMLVAWSDFEDEVDRAARRHLGTRLAAIHHFGSYGCRRMSGNAGRLSLHARARAFDISGFELADGRMVRVLGGWHGSRAERRFLRAVATAACRRFSVTLTPDSDRRHRDHLHVDIGPWSKCGL